MQVNSTTSFMIGGHYDPTTGIYTAPFTGLYEFVIQKRSNENMGDFQVKNKITMSKIQII